MKNSAGVAVIVVSPQEDDCSAINTALRDAGHAAHCTHLNDAGDLTATVSSLYPDLVILFTGDQEVIDRSVRACKVGNVELPLLLAGGDVTEESIAATMQSGARDHISLSNVSRLQHVAGRELRNSQLEKSLEQVMNSARQFKSELHSLKQVSVEAIADVQEGIIVNTNPAWLDLFGFPEDMDLMGTPVMDLCNKTDQPALKGGIVACERGKWQDDVLEITGVSHSGEEFQVQFCLENAEHDSCPAVRMIVKPDTAENKTPVSLLEKSLQRDHITGFFNRQHFADIASERVSEPSSGGARAFAYIRLDRFSRATRDIGIIGTDSVIAQFAQLLRNFTQPADVYGRFGGTMFAVMLERGTMDDAEAWANNFIKTVSDAVFEYEKRSTVLTCSIGLCELDAESSSFESALGDAERAAESARQQGGDRVALSEASGAAKQVRQDDNIWVPRIRDALMDNRFRLEHQPVAGLNHEISDAYDILVRMLDEEGNTVLPGEFMPVAERTGMTKNIDRWVIGASLSFCLTNRAELLFVRLSRDSLLDETLTPWLKSQLERTQVTASRICFEIEEQTASEHLAQTIALAGVLRDIGFRFAIEHFGKSPDAKQLLGRIPLDLIKIDGSLMQGLHKNADTQERVKEIARAASDAGIRTVAERVQDANTMAVLWQLGVSYIQGNYIQKRDIVLEDTSHSSVTTRALQLQS